VYAKVIKDVCEASRVDFEEGGVDLNALDMLRQVRNFFLHYPSTISSITFNCRYPFLMSASRLWSKRENHDSRDQNVLHRRW